MNHIYFSSKPASRRLPLFAVVALCLLALSFSGCRKRSNVLLQLYHVNANIQEHPDSALELLSGINKEGLKDGEEKALYGLLLTMAEDKNYLDPKNDTIISYASEYFTRKGDILNRIRSDYYRGRVLYHNQDFPAALVSFFKAKDAAEENDEYFWEGMSYRGISDVYLQVSASADELHYAKLEYESFKKSGVQPYLNYALTDLARAYNNSQDYELSLKIADEAADSALLYDDPNLYVKALRLKSGIHFWSGDIDEAFPLLEELYESGYGTNVDSLYYIYSLLKLKNQDVANEAIDKISDDERPYKEYIRYQIYKEMGDYKRALEELEIINISGDNDLTKKGEFNLASSLTNYYNFERELKDKQIKIQRYKIGFIISLSVLFSIIVIFIVTKVVRRYKKELNARILFMEELEERIRESESRNEKSDGIIRNLFGNQYSIIEKSCEILNRNTDASKADKQISRYITNLIEQLSVGGKLYKDIEKQIDLTYDNLMTDLMSELPKVSKMDQAIYLYSVLGFPSDVTAFLLGVEKVQTIYNRKRHLKERIRKLGGSAGKRYLKYL